MASVDLDSVDYAILAVDRLALTFYAISLGMEVALIALHLRILQYSRTPIKTALLAVYVLGMIDDMAFLFAGNTPSFYCLADHVSCTFRQLRTAASWLILSYRLYMIMEKQKWILIVNGTIIITYVAVSLNLCIRTVYIPYKNLICIPISYTLDNDLYYSFSIICSCTVAAESIVVLYRTSVRYQSSKHSSLMRYMKEICFYQIPILFLEVLWTSVYRFAQDPTLFLVISPAAVGIINVLFYMSINPASAQAASQGSSGGSKPKTAPENKRGAGPSSKGSKPYRVDATEPPDSRQFESQAPALSVMESFI